MLEIIATVKILSKAPPIIFLMSADEREEIGAGEGDKALVGVGECTFDK